MNHDRSLYAGLGEGFSERNDCAVRATAIAGCIDYAEAHAVFTKHGRKIGHPSHNTIEAILELFPDADVKHAWIESITTKRFAETHPQGHYILLVRGHALALTDGVIHDWVPRPRAIVMHAIKLWRKHGKFNA